MSERTRTDENTVTLKCDGKEQVFKVAKDAKVTMNGRKGYSFADLNDTSDSYKPKVRMTIENGVAESLDVTLTFPKGHKLCDPGMSPVQVFRRKNAEILRQHDEKERQPGQ